MAQITDAAPIASQSYGTPPVDVTALYQPTSAYVVFGLTQETRIRPSDGKMIPTIAVLFRVPGLPGNFTIRIDNYAFDHADPLSYMDERSYLIRGLYALPEVLPPYSVASGYASGVIVALDSATPATLDDGSGAVAWTGSVLPRGVDATARLEATALGDADPTLVSAPIPVTASDAAVPLSGTLGPLDAGKYVVQLTADSSLGIGLSPQRAVTIP